MAIDVLKQLWPEWKIEKRIGGGTYGDVYEAIRSDYNVENREAIKIITIPANEAEMDSLRAEGMDMDASRTYLQGIVTDFVNEIRLMVSLSGSPNIVDVKDYRVVEKVGEIGWYIFIRMELLTPFDVYTCDKKLSENDIIKLGYDICTALETCAEQNIIHRDIKPGNILVHKGTGSFKLGDFGIARTLKSGSLSQRGTPNYMAPEVANRTNYDSRVDIYSLGIVLYRLLNANRLPFWDEKQLRSPNEMEYAVNRRINGEELPAPCDASPEMAALILRACAYDPNMRFASATEMKQALISVANGTYQATGVGNLDKTTSVRRAPADYDRTTFVRRVPDASNQKAGQSVNTFGATPKKKNRLPAVIAAVLAVVALVSAGIFVVPKFISNDNSNNSSTISYSPFDEEQIASIISEAETLAADGDYEGALTKIKTGLVTYPKSEALQEKEAEYTDALAAQVRQRTLEEAANLAEAGDYVSAIALIKNAQDTNGEDPDYTNAYNAYCASYKTETISVADELAINGDYIGAFQKIVEASAIIGDDSELTAKAQEFEDAYVSATVTGIESHLEVNDFNSAERTLATALAIFPTNQTLLAEKDVVKNAMPQSLLTVCPPYRSENCEEWKNLSMGGTKYAVGVSIGRTGSKSGEGYALFNLGGKFRTLAFDVGNIDDRGSATNEALYIYLDGKLAWSLDLDPEALPKHYEVDVSGAKQMKIVGTAWAGDFGITNMVIAGVIRITEFTPAPSNDGEMLLSVCPPYKTDNYEEWSHLSIAGTKYASGISVGRTGSKDGEGYALFNLQGKYTTISFDVGNIDSRGTATDEALYIYIDDNLVWSLNLNPEALPTHHVVDVSGASQMKIIGSAWAGDFGIFNLRIK